MEKDSAVSAVISESLMIALVLILVPFVTISLMNQLPQDRIPTVTITMSSLQGDTVTLYHKGGDWVRTSDITVTLNGEPADASFSNPVFDLGNAIIVHGITKGDTIGFVVKNAVVFSGTVQV